MSYNGHTEKTALFDWIEAQEFNVFGTVKFTKGADVTDEHGERTVRAYFNALDRVYFGHAVENVGMRHKRLVLRHTGICSTNLHYHFLAKPLTDANLFIELAKKQWGKMSSWTMAADETQIERVRSTKATAAYILHEYSKQHADCLCLSACSLQPAPRPATQYRSLAQTRRLLRLQAQSAHEDCTAAAVA